MDGKEARGGAPSRRGAHKANERSNKWQERGRGFSEGGAPSRERAPHVERKRTCGPWNE
jgi:hypothetical protein